MRRNRASKVKRKAVPDKLSLKTVDILAELNTRWKKARIRTVETATDSQLNEFEVAHKLKLPQDLRAYFTTINGTDGEPDNEFFTFCTFAQFQPASQVLGAWQNGNPRHSDVLGKIDRPETCYVFADYSIYLIAYAIRLSSSATSENEVYAICGGEYRTVAKSFSEFIELYSEQGDKLTF